MSRKFAIAVLGLLLTCAMTGGARADSLSDPTRPPTAGSRVQQAGGLQLEGVLCHAGAFVAIVNDRLVHAGDRVDGALIRSISAEGISYSRGSHKRFAYAPEPWLEGCTGAASASQPTGEPLIGVDVAGAPARVFFEGLVENTPYNVLVHPDVTGRVTISLKNVTLQQLSTYRRGLSDPACRPPDAHLPHQLPRPATLRGIEHPHQLRSSHPGLLQLAIRQQFPGHSQLDPDHRHSRQRK